MAAPNPKPITKLRRLSPSTPATTKNVFSTAPSNLKPPDTLQQAALTPTNPAQATTTTPEVRESNNIGSPSLVEDALAQSFRVALAFSSPSPPSNITQRDVAATSELSYDLGVSNQELNGPKEHPDFPSENGKMHFLVENTLFAVHGSILAQHSPVFKDMFALGSTPTTEGTKNNPIVLPSLEALSFERFLKILIPCRYDELPFKKPAEWASVLLVADFYDFVECGLRKLALKQLGGTTTTSVEKIVWGEKCGARSLLLKGLSEVCSRTKYLSAQEFAELPMHIVRLIMTRREGLLYSLKRCGQCPSIIRPRILDVDLANHFRISTKAIPLFVPGGDAPPATRDNRPIKQLPKRTEIVPQVTTPHPKTFTFSVDGVLFTVPRLVMNSESAGYKFRHTFVLVNASDNVPGAGTKEEPFKLEGISHPDFVRLLKILFPGLGEKHPAEDWYFVLRIAMAGIFKFSQSEIIALATGRILETGSAIQMILWGDKLGSDPLRIAGYREICNRIICPAVEELKQLSFNAIELVSSARERFMRLSRCANCTKRGFRLDASDVTLATHFPSFWSMQNQTDTMLNLSESLVHERMIVLGP